MIHTNSKINVSVNDTAMGRVAGRRERMAGTTGVLLAIPEHKYKFKHWLDGQGAVVSTDHKLTINSWHAAQYHAVFEDIIMTYQDFVDHDAVETLVYYLESLGLSVEQPQPYGSKYIDTSNIKYYSAGNYPTGPATRTSRTGETINTYPGTYGYNYWTNPADSSEILISQGTHDASTNTTPLDSTFKRDPATTQQLPTSGFALSRLPPGGISHYYANHEALARGQFPDDGTGYWGWQNPSWGVYNNPSTGAPSHFPLLEYSGLKHFYISNRTADTPDMTGLEKLNAYGVYNWSEARCTSTKYCAADEIGYWSIDAMAWWSNLIYASNAPGHYHYSGWKGINSGAQGLNNENVRYFEGFSYNHNLKYFAFASGEYGPREKHPDKNSGWVTKYQHVPESGSYLNMFRYTNINRLRVRRWGNPSSGRSLDHYYKNLKYLDMYESWYYYNGSRETGREQDWQFKSCKDITHILLYQNSSNTFKLSTLDWLENTPKLRSLRLVPYATTIMRYLTAAKSFPGKLERLELPSNTYQSYNPLPKELIHVSVDFDNPNFPATDKSRHQHRMLNFGATITDS